jgi:hypothetical protein
MLNPVARAMLRTVRLRTAIPYLAVAVIACCLIAALPAHGTSAPTTSTALSTELAVTTKVTSPFSAGYGGFTSAAVTGISADWNIPKVTCLTSLNKTQIVYSSLVLEGATPNGSKSPVVAMVVATAIGCNANSTKPLTAAFATFLGGNNASKVQNLSVKFSAGDDIAASITVGASNKVTAKIDDLTTGKSGSFSATVVDASKVTDPEWLINSAGELAKYSPAVNITDAKYVSSGSHSISGLPSIFEITMEDSSHHVMASVSSLKSSGSSFTVTWKRSN